MLDRAEIDARAKKNWVGIPLGQKAKNALSLKPHERVFYAGYQPSFQLTYNYDMAGSPPGSQLLS